jgi:hypothetical protein
MIKAQSKCVWKAKPFKVLTQEITTRVRPAEKSFLQAQQQLSPMSGPDFYVFHALVSHCVIAGTIGAQDRSIPSHAGVSGPEYPSNLMTWKTTAGRWL